MTAVATVVGGGLAGCEAAFALARRGVRVSLVEMRPVVATPAHRTQRLAELVCTNSFKSTETHNAHGLLKAEMRLLGSIVLEAADDARVPGGTALVVDREEFARGVERRVEGHPLIEVKRQEVDELPTPGVIATGPLTSDRLAASIARRVGADALAFYDAIAPIVAVDSLNLDALYRASRYGKGGPEEEEGAYLNAPLDEETYERLVEGLIAADQYPGQDFDPIPYFEGCLPVEEMARRGRETLRFGPLKPVGLPDPRSGRVPHAVVQLRSEDRNGQMWNLVGFQTRLRTAEQRRVLRQIPGLEAAEFLRYGSVHRNSYLNTPAVLGPALQARDDDALLFAGQLTGVEGYTESAATGVLAGVNLARVLAGEPPVVPPPTTMLGGLLRYLREADPARFQPMNANFGLLEPLAERVRGRAQRKSLLAERALAEMQAFADSLVGAVQV